MSDSNYEPTRLIRKSSAGQGGAPNQPPSPGPSGRDPEETIYEPPTRRTDEAPTERTRIIRKSSGGESSQPPQDDRTVLVRPSSSSRRKAAAEKAPEDLPEGPVVGWLVVVAGPGRGRSVTLGYGMNPIGRDPGNRVCLPFGDQLVSRLKHATITYDPRGRKFFIQHGDSSNLTYLGEVPVLAPAELTGGESIRLGNDTVLKFVPLCGEDFDWEDSEKDAEKGKEDA